jgi:Skp family chaperone for outer membrane proteins
MKRSILVAASAAIAVLASAPMALAQAKPPTAAPTTTAPAITANLPGICVLSREALIGGSTVGKYVQTRMGQLSNQVNAELSGEQTALQADAKALEAKKATLQPAQYQQQGEALQQRAQALQQKAQQRDRELQATEQKAISRVFQEATPLVGDVVKAKSCAVVLDAQSILAANPTMDVTPGVVTALNAKFTQFEFERERLDGQAAPQQR